MRASVEYLASTFPASIRDRFGCAMPVIADNWECVIPLANRVSRNSLYMDSNIANVI